MLSKGNTDHKSVGRFRNQEAESVIVLQSKLADT